MGGLRSIGLAEAVEHAADQIRADRHLGVVLAGNDRSCSWMPSISSSGMESTWPSRKPITCVRMRRPVEVITSQKSPTADGGSARGHQHADQFDHFAGPGQQFGLADLADVGIQIERPGAMSSAGLQLVGQAAFDLAQLGIDGSVQRAAADFKEAPPFGWTGSPMTSMAGFGRSARGSAEHFS